MRQTFFGATLTLLALILLSSVQPQTLESVSAQQVQVVNAAPTPLISLTPSATEEAQSGSMLVWWPAPLKPEDSTLVDRLLRRHLAEYQTTYEVTVNLRIKRPEGLGGIYETLSSAVESAPSVVPDLVLVRYSEMVKLASAKLAQSVSLEDLGLDDLFPAGVMIGQMQGVQYGVPYLLETQHSVYRTARLSEPPRTLDSLLKMGQKYLFAARPVKTVNSTFLAQYIAAGGRLVTENGNATLDREPLMTVLRYYDAAVKAGIAGPELLDFTTVSQYWPQFMTGRANIVQIDSTTFLAQRSGGMPSQGPSAVGVSALPMPGSDTQAITDGWVWVLTTSEQNRRGRALQILAWLLDPHRQAEFLQAMGMLPSRRSSLEAWQNDDYANFVLPLLEKAGVPLPDMIDQAVGGALQGAFEDVLLGRKSVEAAADDAISKITT